MVSNFYLKMSFYNHGEVGIIILWNILLVLTKLDGYYTTQMRTRIIPKQNMVLVLYLIVIISWVYC